MKEEERVVVSVLGMGGLGKTTLARKVFNAVDVKGRFDCYAWVCVSQEYTTLDLLQRTVKSFRKPTKEDLELMEKMNEEDLEQHLYQILEGKRYLVVIDDVWHKEAWESLRRAFPDNGNASRVLITTRNKAVAVIADEKSFVHKLRFLTREESWRLFCKKAFNHCETEGYGRCPPGLEELGREMVEKCGGLPLAIIVLGGLLSRKQTHEWNGVKNHIWRHLTKDSVHVSAILALSYDELPYQLKSCFLYLSLFPEDFVINAEKLIRLWIAEGFIPQSEGLMEEVADEYLKELVDRSMIQVAEKDLETIKSCRIHDLLRDLAVKKAKELSFLEIYDGNTQHLSSSTISCRRQAIHCGNSRYVSLEHSNVHIRSLFFFNPDHESLKVDQLKLVQSRFRLLRVLDLEDTRVRPTSLNGKVVRLSDTIGKLIHLRYLGFKSIENVEFPSSIGNLRSLQTLQSTGNGTWIFPVEICKLTQLRHLIAKTQGFLPVSTLTNLQTLKSVKFSQWIEINTTELTNLRELGIRDIFLTEIRTFSLNSVSHLRNLQTLMLQTSKHFPSLLPLCDCSHLLKLKLDGKLENFPQDVEFPPNLTVLVLNRTKLKQDPIPTLETLQNLIVLDMGSDSYYGYEMYFSSQGFPQLQVLRLSWLRSLETLVVEDGALPRLRTCSIEDCNNLLSVPESLRMLPVSQDW